MSNLILFYQATEASRNGKQKTIKQIEHFEEKDRDGKNELNKKHCSVEVPSKQDYVVTYKESAHDTHDKEDKQNVKTENQMLTSNDRVKVLKKKIIRVWYSTTMKKISKFAQYLSR